MSWLGQIFGRKNSEGDAAFEKLSEFLNSDTIQNSSMPDDLLSVINQGEAVDSVAGATGEFGRTASNPIPVNGPIGEITYLSSLELNDGRNVWAHRLGSIGRVDVFEIVSEDGKDWFLLYFALYHPRKSNLVPRGFRFRDAPRVRGIFATNQNVFEFPHGLQNAIREWCLATLGMPLRSPGLTTALQSVSFCRPAQHVEDTRSLIFNEGSNSTKDARYLLLQGFTQSKLMAPFLSALKARIGYEKIDVSEILLFCASITTYCYLHFGPEKADHEMLDTFHQLIVDDIVTASLPSGQATKLYQTRYQEYSALIRPAFDPTGDQRHYMTTLMMHACERASHATAQGKMIQITLASTVLAVMLDDSFKFAKRMARPRPSIG